MNHRVAELLKNNLKPLAQARTLPGDVFTSEEIFREERRRIFDRSWWCVGREAELQNIGDYFVRDVLGESILVVRGSDGLHAHYNVCRHRGSQMVQGAGCGLAKIMCPYHAWSYHLDGSLHAAPQLNTHPQPELKSELSLVPVNIGSHLGFVFVKLTDSGPSFDEYSSTFPDVARYRTSDLVTARRVVYDVAANWKLACQNFSECYHCPGAHPQVARICDIIARTDRPQEYTPHYTGGPMKLRDGVETLSMTGRSPFSAIPGLPEADRRLVYFYLVYPSLMISPHPDYFMIHRLMPISPGRTLIECEWLTQELPNDTADVVEFWDLTNRQDWTLCERVQASAASPGFRTGPYLPIEDCVHAFDQWYAGIMLQDQN